LTVAPGEGITAATGGAREIAFDLNGQGFTFTVPPPGDKAVASVFLVGLPKAGSTLLNTLMRPLTTAAGLTFVGLQEVMYRMGVPTGQIPPDVNAAFEPSGYTFGAFRSLPGAFELPPYAADRTIVLVRDPRDMLTSLYFSLARSHRPPGAAVGGIGGELAAKFQETREEVNRQGIDAFALENAEVVAGQFGRIRKKLSTIPHRLYRYEDIIFDKMAWARDMLGWLRLDLASAVIEEAVARNDVRPEVEDADQHIRKVSPGDHVEKLKADTIAELNARFEPILRRHHYL
jgi:hypothetical protein